MNAPSTPAAPTARPSPKWLPILLAVGFAIAHTQSPLFYSNQNQYLLHGLAQGGYGHLSNDWLANTKDPTPFFSLGVTTCYRVAGLWPLQAVFFLILCFYFLVAWNLVRLRIGTGDTTRSRLGFAALFTFAHAAGPRLLSVWFTGVDYPWFLQAGVAGQYALGPGLQPSCFAVLLFASLAAYASGRPVLAAALAATATWFHATYLLPAAFLTLGYMANTSANRNWGKAFSIGIASLFVALPVVVYVLVVFRPDDPVSFAESQRILATVRIPHHSVISRWFDGVAALQLVWIVFGLFSIRRTTLFLPLTMAAMLAAILSLVQLVTANPTLALLFPWRLSVVLVPFATILVCSLLARRIPTFVSIGLLAITIVSGMIISVDGRGYKSNVAEEPMLEYVKNRAGVGDCYLLPAKFPAVGTGRGSMSASFTPPPRPRPGSNLIPVDLQRFRLATGASIYVDFKSVPYAPLEVLEWERRMKQVEKWYTVGEWKSEEFLHELLANGITHVILPVTINFDEIHNRVFYKDDSYVVIRMRPRTIPNAGVK